MKRFISLLLLVFLLCPLLATLCSCDDISDVIDLLWGEDASDGAGSPDGGSGSPDDGTGSPDGEGDPNDTGNNGGDGGAEEPDPDSVTLDLSDFALVRASDVADTSWHLTRFLKQLKEKTGLQKEVTKDKYKTEREVADPEILLGRAKRPEVTQAMGLLKGKQGYVISAYENKIVICGTDQTFLDAALLDFSQRFLTVEGEGSKCITLPREPVVVTSSVLTLATGSQVKCTLVYDDVLDVSSEDCPEPNGAGGLSFNPDQVDYPYHLVLRARERLSAATGVPVAQIKHGNDTQTVKGTALYMGYVNIADAQEYLGLLAINEYGVFTNDKNVMILAWNDETLQHAYTLFWELLERYATTDKSGKTSYSLPTGLSVVKALDNKWVTEFPRPAFDNLLLAETVDVWDDAVEYIYTGAGATSSNFREYCSQLVKQGYVLNNTNAIEGSLFRTYYNAATGVVLHVSFMSYSHAAEFKDAQCLNPTKQGGGVTYPDWPVSIRVVAAPRSSVNMLDEYLLERQKTYQKITDSMLTSVNQSASATGYILTLEDGSFFIFDSGSTGNGVEIYDLLLNLYKKTHNGRAPTKEDPIVIAGWFLSHIHGDHTGKLKAFCQQYADSDLIEFKYFFANLPGYMEQFNSCGRGKETWKSLLFGFADEVTCIKVHSGDRFFLANVEFEILYTHEDMHPVLIDFGNEYSTIIRATIKNSNNGAETDFLFVGDTNRYTGFLLCAMYGDYLQSDMMNMAHHGWVGPYEFFYDTVAPKILWWPNSARYFKQMSGGQCQGEQWYHGWVDKYVATQLSSIRYIFVADSMSQTLILKKEGMNYSNIFKDMFNAETFESIGIVNNINIKK